MIASDELAQIEARAAAATPGPWEIGVDSRDDAAALVAQPRYADSGKPFGCKQQVVIPFGRAFSDARFIASARNDVPALCAELRAAAALLAKIGILAEGARFEFEADGADGLRRVIREIAALASEGATS